VLIAIPLLAPLGERHPARRPWAILVVGVVVIGFISLLVLGYRAPWVPAVDSPPVSLEPLGAVSESVRKGALVFHERGCQLCHIALGRGGKYGPELTDVARRLSPEEITVRTMNGVRDMPAYRNILTLEEISQLVAFFRAIEDVEPRRYAK
jgi:ubiquinol-cytochrome c reductase cytochrome b subunit